VFRLPAFPRLHENNVRTGFLEDNQYGKLFIAASELWLRAMIGVARIYGWRKRELLNLRIGQVDLKRAYHPPGTRHDQESRRPGSDHDRQRPCLDCSVHPGQGGR